ncbi:MAG: LL-diaminopimelate aminotransferase [Armatimonadota bacterium]
MQTAQRLQKIPPYPFREIADLKVKARADGVDLIDFGIGDPDQPTPKHVIDAFAKEIYNPQWHRYDETGYGDERFREVIARYASLRFGIDVDPASEIQVATGSKDSLAKIIWAYVDPGDIVLVPDPAYPVYRVNTMFCAGAPYPMPLLPENGFLPDLSAIPTSVAKAAKMLWLCYPNNPTGAVAEVEYFREVAEFARRYDILVCNDAAYIDVAYDGYQPHSFLEADGGKDVCIEFHSLSKRYNMTGWRLGWSWGSAEAVAALSKMKSNVDNGTFLALQRAGAAALAGPQKCVDDLCETYRRRRDLLVGGLRSLGCDIEPPRAAFYVWAPVPRGYTSESFARALLTECAILVTPGSAYGEYGEGFVRFSLTILADDPEVRIREAIGRIEDNLQVEW